MNFWAYFFANALCLGLNCLVIFLTLINNFSQEVIETSIHLQQAFTAISFLVLAGLLAMYSIRFSKLSEAQYSRSVLPRHPSVLIGLTGALVVLFSLRAVYEVLAASSVWSLRSFPPLLWSHAAFFLAFDLAPVLISLSLTARIPSQQAADKQWEVQDSAAPAWDSPSAVLKHSSSTLVHAQLLQPLTSSETSSPAGSENARRRSDDANTAAHANGSIQSSGSMRGRRGLHSAAQPVDYGVFASMYGQQQRKGSPSRAPQSAPGAGSDLLASLALPRVASLDSMRSTSSAGSLEETRLMLPGSYNAPIPAALQRLQKPNTRIVAHSAGHVSAVRLNMSTESGAHRSHSGARFHGSEHFNHPARYDLPIDDAGVHELSSPGAHPQGGAFAFPRSTLAPSQAASQLVQHLERTSPAPSAEQEALGLHLQHLQGTGHGSLYAEDSPSAANLLG